MKRRTYARGLLVAALSVVALTGGTGVASADSDTFVPAGPGIIDQIVLSTPILSGGSAGPGNSADDWGGVGMYCQNLLARCH